MNRTVKIVLYILFGLLLGVLIVVANVLRLNSNVRGVKAMIDYHDSPELVSSQTIEELVISKMPTLLSTAMKDVNCDKVRAIVESSPYVKRCEASTSIGGQVVIHIEPRVPIVHVFWKDEEFYLDGEGHYMPMSTEGVANVIVANGEFRDPLPTKRNTIDTAFFHRSAGEELSRIWTLADYLDHHPDCGQLFDQIYLASNRDLFLTPKLGNHVVQVGDPDNLDTKMFNLLAFYKKGCPKVGWDLYSQISVKYSGQVICTRRNKN